LQHQSNPGQIIILNGAPRSGKSSIAAAIQETFEGVWMNLGVDAFVRSITPERYRPGIGLRPGAERPDLEPLLPTLFAAMYESVAAHSRLGLNVVVDVGHHNAYTKPLNILAESARRLEGLPVLFVGVLATLEAVMTRRNLPEPGREADYVRGTEMDPFPLPVVLWQREVHLPGTYDLEVDTSVLSPRECANLIGRRLRDGPAPTAFHKLAAESGRPRPGTES